jgi:acyl dehydratase
MTPNDSPWKQTRAGQPRMGARAERRRTTSMRDVEMFTEMTGDRNPIHYDADLLNAVVAEDLPGPGTVFLETNWRFVKAVRVGETITATVEVEHVRSDKPICKLKTTVRNEAGEDCVLGTATTYTMPLVDRQDRAAR